MKFQRTLQHADDQRFRANEVVEPKATTPIQVVLHWAASLQPKSH